VSTYTKIWQFLQGKMTDQERKAFRDWLKRSKRNHQDFLAIKRIWEQSQNLQDYILLNPEEGWKANSLLRKELGSRKILLSRGLGYAAVLLLLISLLFWFFMPKERPLYQEFHTQNQAYEIVLPDSSKVQLDTFSSLTYFSRIDQEMSKRVLYLKGRARFEVTSDSTRPFIVQSGRTGTIALGTEFVLEQMDSSLVRLENIEGLLRFYELADEDHEVLVRPGEIFTYDGTQFLDDSPKPAIKIEKGEIRSIESILNYLFFHFDGRFNTGPYGTFDLHKEIRIDLDQKLEDIIADLDQKTEMVYRKTCSNCYEIRSILVEED
jgi:ferric-dicitrate binding protein FerR (iron transport regulator)